MLLRDENEKTHGMQVLLSCITMQTFNFSSLRKRYCELERHKAGDIYKIL